MATRRSTVAPVRGAIIMIDDMPDIPDFLDRPAVTINFVADAKTRDDLHAAARVQDRSMSALIRVAVRAWLNQEAAPPTRHKRAEVSNG
jgi:hypothetical protein